MQSEIVKQENDVTVLSDKSVFISQRKLAEILGVNESTMFKHIKSKHKNYNTSNGLDAYLVKKVSTYYAYKGYDKAQDLVDKFIEAGATAYLYTLAGYKIDAVQPTKPTLSLPSLKQYRHEVIRPIMNQHGVLMGLVDMGILDVNIKTIKKFKYTVTEYGKMLGYKQNTNGTVLEPEQ